MTSSIATRRLISAVVKAEKPGRRWRIRGSGVRGWPCDAPLTREIMEGLKSVGIEIKSYSRGSPANADSYHVEAVFLDGGIKGMTGSYWYGTKGCWIDGPRALVLVAVLLNRRIPERLLAELRLADPQIDAFLDACRAEPASLVTESKALP